MATPLGDSCVLCKTVHVNEVGEESGKLGLR